MIDIVQKLKDACVVDPNYGKSVTLTLDYDDYMEAANTITALRAEVEKLRSDLAFADQQATKVEGLFLGTANENEKLRAALKPFADMGKAMMGRKHHNEAVVQYALAPTIFVHHLVSAHEVRAALEEKP